MIEHSSSSHFAWYFLSLLFQVNLHSPVLISKVSPSFSGLDFCPQFGFRKKKNQARNNIQKIHACNYLEKIWSRSIYFKFYYRPLIKKGDTILFQCLLCVPMKNKISYLISDRGPSIDQLYYLCPFY